MMDVIIVPIPRVFPIVICVIEISYESVSTIPIDWCGFSKICIDRKSVV